MTNLINPIKNQARKLTFCQKMSFVVCEGTYFYNYSILKIKNGLHTKIIALSLVVQKIDFGLDRWLRHENIKYEFLYLQYVSAHNWSNVSSFSFEFFLPILVICVEVVFWCKKFVVLFLCIRSALFFSSQGIKIRWYCVYLFTPTSRYRIAMMQQPTVDVSFSVEI